MPNIIIVNGVEKTSNEPTIYAFDRGLTLGHGLFETLLVNKGNISALEYHWDRLLTSAKIIDIKIPFSLNELAVMIENLLLKNHLQNKICSLRITITDGISERGLLSTNNAPPTYILTISEITKTPIKSIKVIISSIKKNEHSISHMVKSISYLDNILAKKEAISKNADEAFMLNSRGNISEGTISNIFALQGRKILTPPLKDGALPGITRRIILNDLKLKNYTVIEKSMDLSFLMSSDEIFISNSLMGTVPVESIQDQSFKKESNITEIINKFLNENFCYL